MSEKSKKIPPGKDGNTDQAADRGDGDMEVPEEIDTHLKLFGKRASQVQYGERCPICEKRIDEYGFCACGSAG